MSDDAVSVLLSILMKMLEMLEKASEMRMKSEELSLRREEAKMQQEEHIMKMKEGKPPVIKSGEVTMKDIEAFTKEGGDVVFQQVDKRYLDEIKQEMSNMGGTFVIVQSVYDDIVRLGIPESQMHIFDVASKSVSSKNIQNLKVNDGIAKIDEKDLPLVKEVMEMYSVPIMAFKSKDDGKCITLVDKRHIDNYNKAMGKVNEIKKKLNDIEFVAFDHTGGADITELANKAKVITHAQAVELNKAVKAHGLDVQFTEKDGDVAVLYPSYMAEKVEDVLKGTEIVRTDADKFLINVKKDITDPTFITLDIKSEKSLLTQEYDDAYLMRVPGTHMQDFIKINKADCEMIMDGGAVKTRLDPKALYDIYDKDGVYKSSISGEELLAHYERKIEGYNKETKPYIYGSGKDRIELFNKEENKVYSIGLDNYKEMRSQLLSAGIDKEVTEVLLKDINKELEEEPELREKFDYVTEQAEPVYVPIPNIDNVLSQTYIAEIVLNKAQFVGEKAEPMKSGKAYFVHNKADNTYTVGSVENMKANLSSLGMGYVMESYIQNKVMDEHKIRDAAEKQNEVMKFSFENLPGTAELDELKYAKTDRNMVIVQENGDKLVYTTLSKGDSVKDIEDKTACLNLNERSTAVIVKQAADDGLIELPESRVIDDVTVTLITASVVELSVTNSSWAVGEETQSVLVPIDELESPKVQDMGISEETIKSIRSSVDKSMDNSSKKETLSGLKSYAKEKVKTVISKEETRETVRAAEGAR